jgi:hypothetical protein
VTRTVPCSPQLLNFADLNLLGVDGFGSIKVHPTSSSMLTTFVELEAKTPGWVAGNVNLGSNVSVRMGGSLRLK